MKPYKEAMQAHSDKEAANMETMQKLWTQMDTSQRHRDVENITQSGITGRNNANITQEQRQSKIDRPANNLVHDIMQDLLNNKITMDQAAANIKAYNMVAQSMGLNLMELSRPQYLDFVDRLIREGRGPGTGAPSE